MTDKRAFEIIAALMDAMAEAISDSAEERIRDKVREICATQLGPPFKPDTRIAIIAMSEHMHDSERGIVHAFLSAAQQRIVDAPNRCPFDAVHGNLVINWLRARLNGETPLAPDAQVKR